MIRNSLRKLTGIICQDKLSYYLYSAVVRGINKKQLNSQALEQLLKLDYLVDISKLGDLNNFKNLNSQLQVLRDSKQIIELNLPLIDLYASYKKTNSKKINNKKTNNKKQEQNIPLVCYGQNLKFTKQINTNLSEVVKKRLNQLNDKPVFLLSSTYPNELELILSALKYVELLDKIRLIVAPRHQQNFAICEQILKNYQLHYVTLAPVKAQFNDVYTQLCNESLMNNLGTSQNCNLSNLNNENLFTKYFELLG